MAVRIARLMLVVDAGALYEVITGSSRAADIARHLAADPVQAAPHVVDVEVFGVIRDHHLRGLLDTTAAHQSVASLRSWRGERYPHGPLLERAWELRENVRGWDAMYVALAESLAAPLLTMDGRLVAAPGPRCRFVHVAAETD